MRTIKFRGKSINKDEWFFGDLIHGNIGGCYILPNEAENLYIGNKVIHETIGQYTGLQDKNGKEIYEGDIITLGVNYKAKIVHINIDVFPDGEHMIHYKLHNKGYSYERHESELFPTKEELLKSM